jgi:hypothetical protein
MLFHLMDFLIRLVVAHSALAALSSSQQMLHSIWTPLYHNDDCHACLIENVVLLTSIKSLEIMVLHKSLARHERMR